jgi:hypothetical protein
VNKQTRRIVPATDSLSLHLPFVCPLARASRVSKIASASALAYAEFSFGLHGVPCGAALFDSALNAAWLEGDVLQLSGALFPGSGFGGSAIDIVRLFRQE